MGSPMEPVVIGKTANYEQISVTYILLLKT